MFGQFERLASTELFVSLALAVFAVPAVFLGLVAVAGHRRMSGRAIGRRLAGALAFGGGASLGTMLSFAPDLAIAAPLIIVVAAIAYSLLGARRRSEAGWLILGTGLPIALAWLLVGLDWVRAPVPGLAATPIAAWLASGLAASGLGLLLVARGDPPAGAPSPAAPAGQPGSRSIGSIAAAIREPAMVGPFGLSELSMLVAFVAVWLAVPFWIPPDMHFVVQVAVPSVVSAIVGTEAYIRAMPPRSRRAFETFSWLGEWELARAKRATNGDVPTLPIEAQHWLDVHPERVDRLEEAALRVEVLLLVDRHDEARSLVERMGERSTSPWERFEVAALRDLVDWRAGGDGALAAMRATAEQVLPRDADERLRAEVTIAIAEVRRHMADVRSAPGDAIEPLLAVRERLGSRADGQVGRALRPRLIPAVLIGNVLFGLVSVGLGSLGAGAPV